MLPIDSYLAPLSKNVHPDVDRERGYCYHNGPDYEQRRYCAFSTCDVIEHNGIYSRHDDGRDDKRSHEEVDHGITPYASYYCDQIIGKA